MQPTHDDLVAFAKLAYENGASIMDVVFVIREITDFSQNAALNVHRDAQDMVNYRSEPTLDREGVRQIAREVGL